MVEHFDNRQINLSFKKEMIKIISYFFHVEEDDEQEEIEEHTITSLPLCHLNNPLKQAFIRRNYFKNTFRILYKTNDDDLKTGISIFYVYRMIDD